MGLKHLFRQIKRPPVFMFIPAVFFIRLMKFFMRTKIVDENNSLNPESYPYITVTWHNRLLFFPSLFPRYARKRTAAMISASRDGQYIANIVRLFGIQTVRGSTSRKAMNAIRESLKYLEQGINVSMTPDGPRGPKYKLSKGPIILASKTGYPVLPIGVNYSSYWSLKSWDNFQIPKPWSQIELIMDKPIKIPPDLNDEEIEHWRSIIEDKLNIVSNITSNINN